MMEIHLEKRTMSISVDLTPLLALPASERLAIADALYDSVPEEELPPRELPEEVKAMLDARLQDYRDNPDAVIPWEEVHAAALARARARQ